MGKFCFNIGVILKENPAKAINLFVLIYDK